MTRKINLACVHPVEDLSTPDQWEPFMHAFDVLAMIFFCQFHNKNLRRIESYVRYTAWVAMQLELYNRFELDEMTFEPQTRKNLQERMDYYLSKPADHTLTQKFSKIGYLHYMVGGLVFALLQDSPLQSKKVNPMFVIQEKLDDEEQVSLNDTIVTPSAQSIYRNPEHPFHHLSYVNTFCCNLSWQLNMFDWLGQYFVFNYYLLYEFRRLLNPYDALDRRVLAEKKMTMSQYLKQSNEYMEPHGVRYRCTTPDVHILTHQILLLTDYHGVLEDGLSLAFFTRALYDFEPSSEFFSD
jgi:hypothetical protein